MVAEKSCMAILYYSKTSKYVLLTSTAGFPISSTSNESDQSKAISNDLLLHLECLPPTRTSRTFSLSAFRNYVAPLQFPDQAISLSAQDIHIVLTFLSRDKPALAYNGTIIRLPLPGEQMNLVEINERDVTIASLNDLIARVRNQLEALIEKISGQDVEARKAVNAGRRDQAKACLRTKKLAEKQMEQWQRSLTQLEETASSIEAASTNVEIVRALHDSSGVLKALNSEVGGAEGVEKAMGELRDAASMTEEISSIISELGQEQMRLDEDEVEDEFEALQKESKSDAEQWEAEKIRARLAEMEQSRPPQQAIGEVDGEKADIRETERAVSRLSMDGERLERISLQ